MRSNRLDCRCHRRSRREAVVDDDHRLRDLQQRDDVVIEHAYASRADRAHRQLLVTGSAELAHDEDVERQIESRARDVVRAARGPSDAPRPVTHAAVGEALAA